jgi:hypothetical protein
LAEVQVIGRDAENGHGGAPQESSLAGFAAGIVLTARGIAENFPLKKAFAFESWKWFLSMRVLKRFESSQ